MTSTTDEPLVPSYRSLFDPDRRLTGTSWSVFGPDDQLGTINFLTPARLLEAVKLVTQGRVFNLDYPINSFNPPPIRSRPSARHHVEANHPYHRDDHLDGFHLQATSQIDALRHAGDPEFGFYGGVDSGLLDETSPALGIHHYARHGILGRGVLLDVERHLADAGRPIDQSTNHMIDVDDLQETIDAQSSPIRPGDILLLRTGWATYYRETLGFEERLALSSDVHVPGLVQSHRTAAWLWDNQISLVASDNLAVEALPVHPESPFFTPAHVPPVSGRDGMLHRMLIARLGLALGELWSLDELAEDCARDRVYQFLVVAKPLMLEGGAGSTANAYAVK